MQDVKYQQLFRGSWDGLGCRARKPSGTLLPFLGSGFLYTSNQKEKGTLIVIWSLGSGVPGGSTFTFQVGGFAEFHCC